MLFVCFQGILVVSEAWQLSYRKMDVILLQGLKDESLPFLQEPTHFKEAQDS